MGGQGQANPDRLFAFYLLPRPSHLRYWVCLGIGERVEGVADDSQCGFQDGRYIYGEYQGSRDVDVSRRNQVTLVYRPPST
jgi:hypothetical protein